MKQDIPNLYERLFEIKDPRRAQGRRHPLPFTLLIIIMSIMSGALSIVAMADFAKRHQKALCGLFNLKKKQKRVPSRVTLGRLMATIDFKELADVFYQWTKDYVPIEPEEWLSIDGKAIGGTVSNANNRWQNFTSIVSVYTQKRRQILALGCFDTKKNNEIAVVQELIKLMDLEGVVFSMDALHCQKDTVKQIVESNNDYVIGVKRNQPKLHESIKKKSNQGSQL